MKEHQLAQALKEVDRLKERPLEGEVRAEMLEAQIRSLNARNESLEEQNMALRVRVADLEQRFGVAASDGRVEAAPVPEASPAAAAAEADAPAVGTAVAEAPADETPEEPAAEPAKAAAYPSPDGLPPWQWPTAASRPPAARAAWRLPSSWP